MSIGGDLVDLCFQPVPLRHDLINLSPQLVNLALQLVDLALYLVSLGRDLVNLSPQLVTRRAQTGAPPHPLSTHQPVSPSQASQLPPSTKPAIENLLNLATQRRFLHHLRKGRLIERIEG